MVISGTDKKHGQNVRRPTKNISRYEGFLQRRFACDITVITVPAHGECNEKRTTSQDGKHISMLQSCRRRRFAVYEFTDGRSKFADIFFPMDSFMRVPSFKTFTKCQA